MPSYVRVSGSWKEITHQYVRVSGTWRPIRESYVRVSGTWRKVFDLVTPGSTTYSTPGTYNFTVPAHNTITAKCNGAGGGSSGLRGAGGTTPSHSYFPRNGDLNTLIAGFSDFNGGTGSNPKALGGQSGYVMAPYAPQGSNIPAAPGINHGGAGGTGSGGTINLSGGTGGVSMTAQANAMPINTGRGGNSPNGGTSKLVNNTVVNGNYAGQPGNNPGGGAVAAYRIRNIVGFNSRPIATAAGGGGGGYSERSYVTFSTGQIIQLRVGLRANTPNTNSPDIAGAPGANGRVIVEWS